MECLFLGCNAKDLQGKGAAGGLRSSNVVLLVVSQVCSRSLCFSAQLTLYIYQGNQISEVLRIRHNITDSSFWGLSRSDMAWPHISLTLVKVSSQYNTKGQKIPVNITLRKWISHRCCLEIQRITHKMSKNNLAIVLRVRGLKKELERSRFHLLVRQSPPASSGTDGTNYVCPSVTWQRNGTEI